MKDEFNGLMEGKKFRQMIFGQLCSPFTLLHSTSNATTDIVTFLWTKDVPLPGEGTEGGGQGPGWLPDARVLSARPKTRSTVG